MLNNKKSFNTTTIILAFIGLIILSSVALFFSLDDVKKEKFLDKFFLNARISATEADINTISTALTSYHIVGLTMPATKQGLKALVTKPTTSPLPRQWTKLMTSVPLDPWGNPYQYKNPGIHNPSSYDLFSMGPDGIANTADDIGNWP